MGYNTTLMVLNDAIHEIDKDPAGWWAKTKKVMAGSIGRGEGESYGFGNHANGFRVVAQDHADIVNVIAVGGNYAAILGRVYNGNQAIHDPEGQLRLLREIAAQHGYGLVKRNDV